MEPVWCRGGGRRTEVGGVEGSPRGGTVDLQVSGIDGGVWYRTRRGLYQSLGGEVGVPHCLRPLGQVVRNDS